MSHLFPLDIIRDDEKTRVSELHATLSHPDSYKEYMRPVIAHLGEYFVGKSIAVSIYDSSGDLKVGCQETRKPDMALYYDKEYVFHLIQVKDNDEPMKIDIQNVKCVCEAKGINHDYRSLFNALSAYGTSTRDYCMYMLDFYVIHQWQKESDWTGNTVE
ncbi:hypothetical protein FJTKL_15300 [Diaporthe vaccinii]|uniref:Uncharacterized protein n=1 Tax=Diaporthe vaccinii TaxID=105482 RepID=A0ABR4E5C6_9PEZI